MIALSGTDHHAILTALAYSVASLGGLPADRRPGVDIHSMKAVLSKIVASDAELELFMGVARALALPDTLP